MKKIIVSILVIGLLLNMAPAIIGDPTTDAADKPDRPEETTDELAFDAEALVDLIDIDELDSCMENDAYADDDIIMVVNVEPSLQESIGVEQMKLKKNGQVSLKQLKSTPKYEPLVIGWKIQTYSYWLIGITTLKIFVFNWCFFNEDGEVRFMLTPARYSHVGLGSLFYRVKGDMNRDIGTGWGYAKAVATLKTLGGDPVANVWASVKCYNDGNVERDGGFTEY